MNLNAAEIAEIKSSFSLLAADGHEAAATFYRHLFRIAPNTRTLFVIDLERQGTKFMVTLGFVAEQIDRWGLLRPSIEDLALRHTAYGVLPEQYQAVGEALVATLSERLGPDWNPVAENAWRKAYRAIAGTMIEAGYRDGESGP